jgi:hypothetical protein
MSSLGEQSLALGENHYEKNFIKTEKYEIFEKINIFYW